MSKKNKIRVSYLKTTREQKTIKISSKKLEKILSLNEGEQSDLTAPLPKVLGLDKNIIDISCLELELLNKEGRVVEKCCM